MKHLALAAVLAISSAFPTLGPARAADLVVLESNVAGIAPGSVLPESAQINLGRGERLVMIAPDGATRSVAGPFAGPVGRGAANAPGAIQRLTGVQDRSEHVVGAIRAPRWELD